MKRKPLGVGNRYFSGPAKSRRFRVSELWFRGPNPGVAIQWLTVGGSIAGGQFVLCKNEAEFWRVATFQRSIDMEDAE